MKPISALCPRSIESANQASSTYADTERTTSSTSPTTGLKNRQMVNLWEKLTAIYGHRWTSQFGDCNAAMEIWQKGIADLTKDELGAGLRALLNRNDPWPPSLPEFRALCRPPKPDPAHVLYRALQKPKANPERAMSALNAVRDRMSQGLKFDPVEREQILRELAARPSTT